MAHARNLYCFEIEHKYAKSRVTFDARFTHDRASRRRVFVVETNSNGQSKHACWSLQVCIPLHTNREKNYNFVTRKFEEKTWGGGPFATKVNFALLLLTTEILLRKQMCLRNRNFDNVKSKIKLEQNANKLIRFFHEHHLTVNTSKTEFMIFGKSKRKDFSEQIILDSIPIDEKTEVKYLKVHIDSNLTFQEEVKHILRKMDRGIKKIYAIRKKIPQKLLILVLNTLVLSHLHYSAVIIHAIEQNLLMSLEKQLNWSSRATFLRQKFESVQDIKCSRNILPVKLFLKTKRLQNFWKIKKQLRPAFSPTSGRPLITWNLHESIRTKKIVLGPKFFVYQKAKLVC